MTREEAKDVAAFVAALVGLACALWCVGLIG